MLLFVSEQRMLSCLPQQKAEEHGELSECNSVPQENSQCDPLPQGFIKGRTANLKST